MQKPATLYTRSIRLPALVIHGERDELIPFAQGERISRALAGPVRFVPVSQAGHNDLFGERVARHEARTRRRQS